LAMASRARTGNFTIKHLLSGSERIELVPRKQDAMTMIAISLNPMIDSELSQAIQDELGSKLSIDDRKIGVSVTEGIATLAGTTDNFFVRGMGEMG
jgi:hypothetical protein